MTARFIALLVCAFLFTLGGCGEPASGVSKSANGIVTLGVKLVDDQGNPVEGADVGAHLICAQSPPDGKTIKDSSWKLPGFERAKSGKDGLLRFRTGERQVAEGPFLHAVAWHAERKLIGIALPKLAWRDTPGEIVMAPECRVKFHLACPELETRKRPVQSATIHARWADEDPFKITDWMELKRLDGNFEFPSPAGDIRLLIEADDTQTRDFKFTVPVGKRELDLGAIDLKATELALRVDQPAPEFQDVVAWVNSQPLDLAKVKGKVVVLDFWGHWCGACVIYGIPELLDLHDQFRDQGLVIIGVHVSRGGTVVDTAEKLEEKTAQTREKFWKGRKLPFPVALAVGKQGLVHYLDKEPAITADYGVKNYPTDILIDRHGKIAASSVGYPISARFREAMKKTIAEK
jgi:thiol-disulfide isomerase/thioredoxin